MKKFFKVIFLAVLVLFSGCYVPTKHYTRTKDISLILESVGDYNGIPRIFLIVSNPTSERVKLNIRCCNKLNSNFCATDIRVVLKPRSDKKISAYAFSSTTCFLIQ